MKDEQKQAITKSSLSRMAGNIAAGMVTGAYGDRCTSLTVPLLERIAGKSVALALLIATEIDVTTREAEANAEGVQKRPTDGTAA